MIKPISQLFFLLVSVLFLFNSCDKEETRLEIITQSPWNLTDISYKLPSENTWNPSGSTCNYDDVWEFTSNSITIYNGTNLCQSQNSTVSSLSDFRLAAGDSKIVYTISGYDYEEDIVELTNNILITSYALNDVNNTQGRRTFER